MIRKKVLVSIPGALIDRFIEKNQFGQILGNPVEDWVPRVAPAKERMWGYYCILEPLDVSRHGADLFKAYQFNNPGDTWTYLPFGPFETYEEFDKWLKARSALEGYIFFTVIDKNTHLPQGIASYHHLDLAHGTVEVGAIHYSKRLQKTRAATEAMYLMMYQIFQKLGYRRYQWRCDSLNQASRNAAERLGFTFEGIFRQTNVFKGRNRDTAWYSIIDSEWPILKGKFEKWLDPNNFDENGNQKVKLKEI